MTTLPLWLIELVPERVYQLLPERTLCLLTDGRLAFDTKKQVQALAKHAVREKFPVLATAVLAVHVTETETRLPVRSASQRVALTNFDILQRYTDPNTVGWMAKELLRVAAGAIVDHETDRWLGTLLHSNADTTCVLAAYQWAQNRCPELLSTFVSTVEQRYYNNIFDDETRAVDVALVAVLAGQMRAVLANVAEPLDQWDLRHPLSLDVNAYCLLYHQHDAVAAARSFTDAQWQLLLQLPTFGFEPLVSLIEKVGSV